jgi:Holliday junction resolvasome RuvABC endonuclease subunit
VKVLGFDPSMTNFGWAIHDTAGHGRRRCPGRGRFQTSSKTLFIARYVDLRAQVKALVEQTGVKRVGCEYPVFNAIWSEGMYGLFLFTCEALWAEGVDVVVFSPGQIKATARLFLKRPVINGKLWKMEKSDMVEAAQKHTGGGGQWNHNEADAYWVARSAARFWEYLDGDISKEDLTEIETKQFTEVHTFVQGKKAGKTVLRGVEYREDERFFRWSSKGEDDGDEES